MTTAEIPYPATVSGSDDLDVDELGAQIIGMAGRLAAATCRWLLLIAAFDVRGGAAKYGLPSTARWLGHYCGLSARTARAHLAVARALAGQPALAEAMGAGRLSYSHVRAIARVAELGDARLLEELIMLAQHGTVAQLEDTVRGLCTVDKIEHPNRQEERETVSHRWRADSYLGLSAKLEPEHGALVQAAIDTIARAEGISQAQALTRIAEIALATVNASDQPAPALRGDERAAIVIHLTADAVPAPSDPDNDQTSSAPGGPAGPPARNYSQLAEHASSATPASAANRPAGPAGPLQAEPAGARPRPFARIAGGPGLPAEVIERLACAARIRPVVFDTRRNPREPLQPLDIGASRRLVSAKQYRALLIRHAGCCAYPGCGHRAGLEAHHVRHWLYGGKTVMNNLILLCPRHHHAHHDGEYAITALGRGRFHFTLPEQRELPTRFDPWALPDQTPIEDEHRDIAADAATTRWDGSHLDRGYAVATLAQFLIDKRSA